jgi:hypothetical protein
MPVRPGDFVFTILNRAGCPGEYIYGRAKLLLQVEFDRYGYRCQTSPTRYTNLGLQMPRHEDAIIGTHKPNLASQWCDNVQVPVNTSDVFVEIVLPASTGCRFQ